MTKEREWDNLNEFQRARIRTEMYFGSREPHTQNVLEYKNGVPQVVTTEWTPALFTAIREIYDNSLDEIVTHGHGNELCINYRPGEMIFSVQDDGRGIPIDFDKDEQDYAATVLLSKPGAGRNFRDGRGATRGLNGVGASIVNFTSEYFQVDITRGGKSFSQRFDEGPPGGTDLVATPAVVMPASKKDKTGTRIEFKPSKMVFTNAILPESFLQARAFELAMCFPNIKIRYNGALVKQPKETLGGDSAIKIEIEATGFSSRFILVPDFDATGFEHSLVNGIPAFNGGAHMDAFKRALVSKITAALQKEAKRRKIEIKRGDILDGLLIFNITNIDAPTFESQTKAKLVTESAGKAVTDAFNNEDFVASILRRNKVWIDAIIERAVQRDKGTVLKQAATLAKKSKKERVLKLEDAVGLNRMAATLFLAEGDSAISGMGEERNVQTQGGLPLRGKLLNCHPSQATDKEIINNDLLKTVMLSLGLMVGQKAERRKLRYGRVLIAADADEDGKNIIALLINFFFQKWPELFDENDPFIFVFETPLIIATKGKNRKYWYADNYDSFDPSEWRGWEIARAKGLAAMESEDWRYHLDNPKVRPIFDDGHLTETLDLLFSKTRADDRKRMLSDDGEI